MLYKLKLVLVSFTVLTGGCAMTESAIPPVQGSAHSDISTDRQLIDEAIIAAEKYWNAQKTSDAVLFHSVTSHELMNVVFDWSYVNNSDILVESASISSIKYHLQEFILHYNKYKSEDSSVEIGIATDYAESIEKGGYPMLGYLLQRGYWETILPHNFPDLNSYKLMKFKYTADVKLQSRGGFVLQKRLTLRLYRMQADSHDSGWKVLFCW